MSEVNIPLYERPEVYQRRWFLLGVLCLSLVMVVMAVSAVNVALPTLQRELGASATMLQWIVDSYALVFAGLLLVAGALGDRFGRKEMLLLGLALFAAGAVVSGFAGSAAIVIVGRAIQGAGAAFVMPATLSLLTAVFPPQERGKAIATWVAFAGAGGALGPVVSGALLEAFWWGSAFLFNLPVVALTAVAIAVYCPRSRDDTNTPLDPPGAVLSLIGLTALLFGVIEGAERGWTDPFVVGSFVVAAVVLAAFVRWETIAEHPMLPISYFADRRFSVGSAVVTTSFFVMFGWLFLFTLYLQLVRGYSPLEAGLATLPLPPALIIMSPRSPAIAARLGTGRTMALGFFLIGAGMAVVAPVTPDTPYVVLAAGMVLLGAGISMTSAPATNAIISAVPPSKAGVASAVNDTTRELGGALGIAVLGTIASSLYRSRLDLGGLDIPASVSSEAERSIGEAVSVTRELPGATAGSLVERAGDAFTDAFGLTAVISAVIVVVAAMLVLRTFSSAKEQEAEAAGILSEPSGRPPVELGAEGAVADE